MPYARITCSEKGGYLYSERQYIEVSSRLITKSVHIAHRRIEDQHSGGVRWKTAQEAGREATIVTS